MRALYVFPGRGRHALRRTGLIGPASGPLLPAVLAGQEIGLGSRRGDVDWTGDVRVFTADHDMGVWVRPSSNELEGPR